MNNHYNPNQPRDKKGMWTDGSGEAEISKAESKRENLKRLYDKASQGGKVENARSKQLKKKYLEEDVNVKVLKNSKNRHQTREIANQSVKDSKARWNDAGLLREHIVKRYGNTLEGYASPSVMNQANTHIKRLAKLTGKSENSIRNSLKKDYNSQ